MSAKAVWTDEKENSREVAHSFLNPVYSPLQSQPWKFLQTVNPGRALWIYVSSPKLTSSNMVHAECIDELRFLLESSFDDFQRFCHAWRRMWICLAVLSHQLYMTESQQSIGWICFCIHIVLQLNPFPASLGKAVINGHLSICIISWINMTSYANYFNISFFHMMPFEQNHAQLY